MAVTGTGTRTDPWKVSSWDELASLSDSTGYIEASKENDVWDLNETNPGGVSATVRGHFDGKGLTVLNAYIPDSYNYFLNFASSKVKNVDFLNVYCRASSLITGSITLENCRFSGLLFGCSFFSGTDNFMITRSALNIKLNNGSKILYCNSPYYHPHFTDSHLKIDSSANGVIVDSELNLNNSLLEGDLTHMRINLGYDSYGYRVSKYSVINAKAIKIDGATYAINTVLYNSDLLISGGSVSSALTPVTTAQLEDAEYLASIGFPIGVD